MSIPKIMGTEHEYGIFLPEETVYNFHTPYHVVEEACLEFHSSQRGKSRSLTLDALARDYNVSPDVARRLLEKFKDPKEVLRALGGSGFMMTNGSRFYVDAGHPEYSTPECLSAKDLLAAEKAGEIIVERARSRAEKSLKKRIDIHKDNSDRNGHSYAAHENYLVSPDLFFDLMEEPFTRILSPNASGWVNFLVTRQIWAGAGKVGSDARSSLVEFQLSQRAEFIRVIRSSDTMVYRGIINTRDHSYADDRRFKRLHVIIGDANMCEVAIFLKVGASALFLKMLEDGFLRKIDTFLFDPIQDPVTAVTLISRDLSLTKEFLLKSGRKVTALEMQKEVLQVLEAYCETLYSPDETESSVLDYLREVLLRLQTAPQTLFGLLDHITKKIIIEEQLQKRNKSWRDSVALYCDFLYHNVDPAKSLYGRLYERGDIERIVTPREIERAVREPPSNTRAWIRAKVIEKFKGSFGTWNILNVNSEGFRRMMIMDNPVRGGKKECELWLDGCENISQLLRHWNEGEKI